MEATASRSDDPANIHHWSDSPGKRSNTSSSIDTEAGILTASESDCYTEEENSSIETASDSEINQGQSVSRKDAAEEDDEGSITLSPQRRISQTRKPAAIFFGTPSKAEHERRDKYNVRVRTRRLLRKDSIELTRRKSGGWEGRSSSVGDETARIERLTTTSSSDEDSNGVASYPSQAISECDAEDLSDGKAVGRSQFELNDLDCRRDICEEHDFKVSLLPAEIEDPDATEDADWFGLKKLSQASSDSVSLPSTPTRSHGSKHMLSRTSFASSDAGSSPGIGRTLHASGGNRPSPFFRTHLGRRQSRASPAFGASRLAHNLDQHDENVDVSCGSYYAASPSVSGGEPLRESPRRSNVGTYASNATDLSPLKIDLRNKLAAWADAMVKVPQSPEKLEFEILRASAGRLAPLRYERKTQDDGLLGLAQSIPLPVSPIRVEKVENVSPSKATATTLSRPSPMATSAKDSHLKSTLPLTRLPRPMKTNLVPTSGTPLVRQQMKASVPVKRALSAQMQSVNRLTAPKSSLAFHRSLPTSSSSVLSRTSPQRQPSLPQKQVTSTASLAKSARPGPPIVRDARLIASRNLSQQPALTHPASDEPTFADETADVLGARSDTFNEPPSSPALRTGQTSSIGVGGARRVAIVPIQSGAMPGPSRTQNAPQKHTLQSQDVSHLSATKTRTMPSRPMRRINDYTRGSVQEKLSEILPSPAKTQTEEAVSSTSAAAAAQGNLPSQSSSHFGRAQASLRASASKATKVLTGPQHANKVAPRYIPLSSAELSKLTSLHTQCNEAGVVQIRLIVVRKQGENRPASPSSRFRKAMSIAASGSKQDRLAREVHDRGSRAAQRSSRFSGDDAEDEVDESDDLMPGAFRKRAAPRHRVGAGEVEVYISPVRRVSLKKVVRWHRNLFAEDSEQMAIRSHAAKSCLRDASRTLQLDRFGNVARAGKPLGSPEVKRRVVQVSRIVYDDDAADAEDV